MDELKIARINELYRKSKAEGLTEAEKEEQKLLRAEYIESIRRNLRSQLDNIDIQEKDGSITNLGDKFDRKKEQIRKQALAQRSGISENTRREYSRKIAEQLIRHPLFLWAEAIYCYVSYGTEVLTNEIFSAAWQYGKKTAVPKVQGAHDMEFYLFDPWKNSLPDAGIF